MKIAAIVQARMGSSRFPRKVMREVCGVPLLGLLLARLAGSRLARQILVASSTDPGDVPLAGYVRGLGFDVYLGSEHDVLDRYYRAAEQIGAEVIVRITGDCPLVDAALVDQVIELLVRSGADYASNVVPPTYPDGLDVEAFTFRALEAAWKGATAARDREHVTTFLRESEGFSRVALCAPTDQSAERWTVDEPADLEVVERVFAHFQPRRDFGWQEVMALRLRHPEYFEANRHLRRNEGDAIGAGQKLWKRAKRVIPGGNMLLSKRAEMFLPDLWPAYFSRAKGCRVWDLDGREYVDMSLMGVGTNTLGYGHPEVDRAVERTVAAGNMSTLNCPEEVYLSERLIELHPWAEMVRLARSGGEANAIAIRIARAATGRERVAICGYHGWHDWYLAANLGDEQNLAGHLLPGLEPRGVPTELKGSTLPFQYNDLARLEELVRTHDIGVIKMEVARTLEPNIEFLRNVRRLASAHGIVLIFDECTSGFRQSFGGLHKLYGVEPDMAVFGKALGNGYAITAVIGRRDVMEAAQQTFISSTFWTERIGPAAALATLEVMERVRSWEQITETGKHISARWQALAGKHQVPIATHGLAALAGFSFQGKNALAYKTLVAQEMLAKGFLASTGVYVCTEHSRPVIDSYFEALDPVFALVKECEEGRDVMTLLKGPVCHSGFKRLN
jgi:glutamate-1-semialdehyde 2,1-aminomutase